MSQELASAALIALLVGAGWLVRTRIAARGAASGRYARAGRFAWIAIAVVSTLIISQLVSVILLSRSSRFEIARRAVATDPLIARSVGGVRKVQLSLFNSASERVKGPVTIVDDEGSHVVSRTCAQTTIALVAVGPHVKKRVIVYMKAVENKPWRVDRVVPESISQAAASRPSWNFSCE